MAKVFVSFLGARNYSSAKYILGKQRLDETRFVQSALIQHWGPDFFDNVSIILTATSKCKKINAGKNEEKELRNWEDLKSELVDVQKVPAHVVHEKEISEDLSPQDYEQWFTAISSCVNAGDRVWFDMTHGYRAFSIILSTALGYLQKTKNIDLQAVYYGAFDHDDKPIIDLKEFYIINEWADAVGQVNDTADTYKMTRISSDTNLEMFRGLQDERIIKALNDFTDSLKNVDVNMMVQKTENASRLVNEQMAHANDTEKELLSLVNKKFAPIAQHTPVSGTYDSNYFRLQLTIIEMLIEHRLFMQAFTVMRELMGSIGMLGAKEKYRDNMISKNGRRGRKYADVFINMVQYNEWKFDEDKKEIAEKLKPHYSTLEKIGIIQTLHSICKDLLALRNGFDHAWTAANNDKRERLDNLDTIARGYKDTFAEVITTLENHDIIKQSEK